MVTSWLMNTSMVPTTNETFNEDTTTSLVSAVAKNIANPFLIEALRFFTHNTSYVAVQVGI